MKTLILIFMLFTMSCTLFQPSSIEQQEKELGKTNTENLTSVHPNYRKRNKAERILRMPFNETKENSSISKIDLLFETADIILNNTTTSPSSYDKTDVTYSFNISSQQGIKYINEKLKTYYDDSKELNTRYEALHKIGLLFSHPFYENRNESKTLFYYKKIKKEFLDYYRIKEINMYLEKQKVENNN